MHDREHVHLALVGERHRTELFALAAFRARDAFWIEINCSALLALDAFEMRLGRQFQPWNDRAGPRVSSSLSLLGHTDPPDDSIIRLGNDAIRMTNAASCGGAVALSFAGVSHRADRSSSRVTPAPSIKTRAICAATWAGASRRRPSCPRRDLRCRRSLRTLPARSAGPRLLPS